MRPGKYEGRFSLALRAAAGSDGEKASIDPALEDPVASLTLEPSGGQPTVALGKKGRYLVSVQVEATLMGKGKGTPQLKGDVRSLGKIVRYDSDDDTEWEGFD